MRFFAKIYHSIEETSDKIIYPTDKRAEHLDHVMMDNKKQFRKCTQRKDSLHARMVCTKFD
jgi:hypothetical protein